MARKEESKMCRGYESSFLNCVGKRPISEFYDSWSIFDNGKSCYCKKCATNIFEHYLKEFNDVKTALFYTCAKVDVPFRKDVYEYLLTRVENEKAKGRNKSITFNWYYSELYSKSDNRELFVDFSSTNVKTYEVESSSKTLDEKMNY